MLTRLLRTPLVGLSWVALCLIGFGSTPTYAIQDPAGVKQERDKVRQDIKLLSEEIQRTTDERAKAKKLIELLDRRLDQSKTRLKALDRERRTLEADTRAMRQREKTLAAELADTESRLGSVLRNQYRRQDINPTQAWLAGQSASRAARESYWYEQVSQAERELATKQRAQTEELTSLRENLEQKQRQLEQTISGQDLRERELRAQRAERRQLITDLDSKLKDQALKKKRLERDDQRLTGLIEELNQAIEQARKRQAAQRAAAAKSRADAPKTKLPPVPSNGQFATLKGRLQLPVEGTVTGKFGQTRESGSSGPAWKGVFIEAIDGKTVNAVASGRVVFAEWLRGFGEIVIIDHGDQYLSVYGNNEKLFKLAGENVKQGEKIAEVGSSSGNLSTGLYFELRHQGKPFDPLSWTP